MNCRRRWARRVDRVPPGRGRAEARRDRRGDRDWAEPAGGGGVAAVELARLAGDRRSTACSAATSSAAGPGARAGWRRVHVAPATSRQRRGFCYVDEVGERTITVIGEKPRPQGGDGTLPWEELERADGVYFTAGDAEAVRQARRARVLVATARELPTLHAAGVELDALVASGEDDAERYQAGDLDPPPKLVVSTAGALGGWAQPGGPYKAARPAARSRTPTAPATASPPGSRTRSRRGWRSRTRSRSRPSGARSR